MKAVTSAPRLPMLLNWSDKIEPLLRAEIERMREYMNEEETRGLDKLLPMIKAEHPIRGLPALHDLCVRTLLKRMNDAEPVTAEQEGTG